MDLAEVARLESVLLRAWPAASRIDVDGWTLLANDGVTGRANANCATAVDPRPIEVVLERAERWQRGRGITPMWRLTPLAGTEVAQLLLRRGYRPHPEPTDVLVAPLSQTEPRISVTLDPVATDAWFDASGRSDHRDVLRSMMDRVAGEVAFASIRSNEAIVAVGLGVVVDDHLSVFAMHTHRDHRGAGHGSAILGALHAWGVGLGASAATLQVTAANEAARALYERAGYRRVYAYRYLRAPD